jgi:hypothetical protein
MRERLDMLPRLNLGKQPSNLSPSLRVHRHEVDDVGPVVAMSVAVAKQLRGDRVTVGLVVDQNSAEASRAVGSRSWRRARKSGPAAPVHLPVMCVHYHSVEERQREMDLTFEKERLTRLFAGRFSAQQVAECLEETATGLGRGAHILSYIPVLAEHATRNRLRARLA